MDIKRRRALGASLSPAGEVYLVCCTGGDHLYAIAPPRSFYPLLRRAPQYFESAPESGRQDELDSPRLPVGIIVPCACTVRPSLAPV
jgi:hypothetical protein